MFGFVSKTHWVFELQSTCFIRLTFLSCLMLSFERVLSKGYRFTNISRKGRVVRNTWPESREFFKGLSIIAILFICFDI